MKSFRGERQKNRASAQIIVTLLALMTTLLLVNFIPNRDKGASSQSQKNTWESSVVKLP